MTYGSVLACCLTLMFVALPAAGAGDFSRMVVFGDSLSDDGNLFAASGGTIPSRRLYYWGRYSNGKVWPEDVASTLKLPLTNLAFAGARSGQGNVVPGGYPGLARVLNDYLDRQKGKLDPKALYVLWAAANDFMYARKSTPLNALSDELVDNIVDAAARLEKAGARFITILTMPDLGITPWALFGSPAFSSAQMTAVSKRFNALLKARLASELPSIVIVDAFDIHSDLYRNPSAYGFDDVSSGCLDVGCNDPDGFLFWDDRHPTAKAHFILAEYFVDQIKVFPKRSHSVGLFIPGTGRFKLLKDRRANSVYRSFVKSASVDGKPLVGDWSGDGVHTVGFYNARKGKFFLSKDNTPTLGHTVLRFGAKQPNLIPIAGDWEGRGRHSIGIYNPTKGTFNLLVNGDAQNRSSVLFRFGPKRSNRLPVVGDWDGDGIDTVGLYNPASGGFVLKNSNRRGQADKGLSFGGNASGNFPVSGDWNGDGYDSIGVYQSSRGLMRLRNALTSGGADQDVRVGTPGVVAYPIGGDWDG